MNDEPSDIGSKPSYDSPLTGEPPPSYASALEPEEPKLSIQYLMAWAACVTLYFCSSQWINSPFLRMPNVFLAASLSMAAGTALTGLLLLVVRSHRRLTLPRYGGEWIWSISGIHFAFLLAESFLVALTGPPRILLPLFLLAHLPSLAIAYLFAVLRSEDRRWKVFFLLMPTSSVASPMLCCLAARGPAAAPQVADWYAAVPAGRTLFVLVALCVAALIDFRQSHRYPWTHWGGILLLVWQLGTTFASDMIFAVSFFSSLQR